MMIYDKYYESTFQAVHEGVMEIIDALKTKGELMEEHLLFKINFMLREVLNNAVEHGNRFNQEKKVHCRVFREKNKLVFEVTDEGDGIDLEKYKINEPDTLLRERNRGYQTIIDMNFMIMISGSSIKVTFDLDQEV